MGMAAGQARLLSITARINHNELRAQQITNAKLRLSDSTQAASDEYIKALNDTQLQFISYDASGNKMTSAAMISIIPAILMLCLTLGHCFPTTLHTGNVSCCLTKMAWMEEIFENIQLVKSQLK